MKTKLLTLTFAILFFSSCSNADFGYNEKSADNFLNVMAKLDEAHEKLLDNRWKTGIDTADQLKNSDWRDVRSKSNLVSEMIAGTSELKHSEKANAYHTQILKYMNDVNSNYFATLKKYLLSKDTTEQGSYKQQLIEIRKTLSDEENKSLEIQKKFLDDAGISHGK